MFDRMDRRSLMLAAGASAGAMAGLALPAAAGAQETPTGGQPKGFATVGRLSTKYRFDDPDMDYWFTVALGWGPAGGLSVGQLFYVASKITDGDAASWAAAFNAYGDYCASQADDWLKRGRVRQSGEMRLNAFACYRSAWQFAPSRDAFKSLYAKQRAMYAPALAQMGIPATFFRSPYKGKSLPGVFIRNANPTAPVVLVFGGSDTCFEEIFFSIGRNLWEAGYSVAQVDLPGQGFTMEDGFQWEGETEKPVAAIVDVLVDRFKARPGRIAMFGYSLGGYFSSRASGYEHRLGAAIASTPIWNPKQAAAVMSKARLAAANVVSSATKRNEEVMIWKSGASDYNDFIARLSGWSTDPSIITVPFLTVAGGGESAMLIRQAHEWNDTIKSSRKDFVLLDAATGADGHVQANNRKRLAQEITGWLAEVMPS